MWILGCTPCAEMPPAWLRVSVGWWVVAPAGDRLLRCRPVPAVECLASLAGDKALDGYSKKKYVCKLLFIFLLGHDIDFGHMEAVNLLSSNRYTEKQIVSVTAGRGWAGWG